MGAHHVLEGNVETSAAHGHACNGGLPGGVGAHQCDQVYVPQHYPAIKQDIEDALPGAAPVRFRLRMPTEPEIGQSANACYNAYASDHTKRGFLPKSKHKRIKLPCG